MDPNIIMALEQMSMYINDKVNLGRNVNVFDYLSKAGYTNLEQFHADKTEYYKQNIPFNLKLLQIKCVSDSATVLQPLAYENYANKKSFCYFVEYNDTMALIPQSFENTDILTELGIDYFKPGYVEGGSIISHPNDFNCAISFDSSLVPEITAEYFINRFKDLLNKYYDNSITIDNNDLMCNGKKIAGAASLVYKGIFMFAIHISIVDMKDIIDSVGLTYEKIPGSLPTLDNVNIKEILKTEVQSWLH